MADKSAMSTPIFDELLGEMTSREGDPGSPSRGAAVRTDPAASDQTTTTPGQPVGLASNPA